MGRRCVVVTVAAAVLLTAACTGTAPEAAPPAGTSTAPAPSAGSPTPAPRATPTPTPAPTPEPTPDTWPGLEVEVLADDLELPWDVDQLASGELLVTEKDRHRILLVDGDDRRVVAEGPEDVWSSGETGLMSIAVDPRDDDRFLTCSGYSDGSTTDVRVVEWTLAEDRRSAEEGEALITGIGSTTGRHGGCRIVVDDRTLWVGTGDAAVGTNPRDLTSLNGKVLRADARTGEPLPDNPFADAEDEDQRLVYSYGHRNVQGLALRGDTLFSAEHGPDVDDEVNVVTAGGDYGWHPVPPGGGEGYDESVPMTDQDLDGKQVEAVWSSGDPTLATSGLAVVEGAEWGRYAGGLAVATLKAQQMVFLPVDEDGEVGEARVPEELTGYGRLRSVRQAQDGSLLVTTSNGSGDQLLRVTPEG
ncbi:PQQ-dependent sugar dehydrogenase [Auraticoccus sp. F435]|uniref:PQQ-dependent sugar dehydrogenase n=1 Tax=Auraticoccus cholistanensis TaxID=2656650 RepID=A0A6A9UPK1_9ACTN|nr:PQQ-dependent sugar dehydrogenase [Auraticoccus cholistanensis]MVA74611.1 PQQ-dependent sugar dehydrogenase [Auraticoccus cholistanensis]